MTTPSEIDPITGEVALDPTLLDEREPIEIEDPPDSTFLNGREPIIEPTPEEAASDPPPPAPPPGQPVAARGISTGNLTCAVCRRPIAVGETYVRGEAQGATHEEPCSHQA